MGLFVIVLVTMVVGAVAIVRVMVAGVALIAVAQVVAITVEEVGHGSHRSGCAWVVWMRVSGPPQSTYTCALVKVRR